MVQNCPIIFNCMLVAATKCLKEYSFHKMRVKPFRDKVSEAFQKENRENGIFVSWLGGKLEYIGEN